MYSKYERQKDKRPYSERKDQYTGPQFLYPPDRIPPSKAIKWNEEGLPMYEVLPDGAGAKTAVEAAAE
uniref:Antimicrobial-like peptide PP-1 n=1 Tax=Metaphire tschiliensis TaxID=396583 RepID=Q867H2_9ANNE|nr:antimicrobial-like peptide PP-1 [Metaphire tschiliensis]AAO16888.1 antimicrobial-like peptide PP-1 [Metaphire tschiliensis]